MMNFLRLTLHSSGALFEGAQKLFKNSGLQINRENPRKYVAKISNIDGIQILFQRQSDIPSQIDQGITDIGITGMDRYLESRLEEGNSIVLLDDLEFGLSKLVIAVPEYWIDVISTKDLAEISIDFRSKGQDVRIATKYIRLVKRFLNLKGINYFSLVQVSGGLEAAPIIGYADIIADITATGKTLKENNLRPLSDGVILNSKAVLIGNKKLISSNNQKLELTLKILKNIQSSLISNNIRSSVNILKKLDVSIKEF